MRRLTAAAFVLIVGVSACSISLSRPRRFEAIGPDGAPVSPSYLAYSFRGSRLNPVHSTSYEAALHYASRRADAGGLAVRDPDSAAATRLLIHHLSGEYEAFLGRYGKVPRRVDQKDADLTREPLWGPLVVRLFQSHLQSVRALELQLR